MGHKVSFFFTAVRFLLAVFVVFSVFSFCSLFTLSQCPRVRLHTKRSLFRFYFSFFSLSLHTPHHYRDRRRKKEKKLFNKTGQQIHTEVCGLITHHSLLGFSHLKVIKFDYGEDATTCISINFLGCVFRYNFKGVLID